MMNDLSLPLPRAADWQPVCALHDIVPDTGVCALLKGRHVAVFRVGAAAPRVYAIDNIDPNANASVLSRGIVGSIGERVVVASPIYKQHFDLASGECIEAPGHSVAAWPARVFADMVWVAL